MPAGAGAANPVVWSPETDFLAGTATDNTYYEVGTNPAVNTGELTNDLLKIVAPDDPEAQRQLAGQLEGQLSVSFILHNDEHHRLFAGSGATGFGSGDVTTAEWYLSFENQNGTVKERQIKGWAPATYTVEYNGGDPVRVTLDGPYADEELNDTQTPTEADTVSTTDEVPFHGISFNVDGLSVDLLQSLRLEVQNITRLIPGATRTYAGVERGAVETTLDHTAVYHSSSPGRTELAYGSAGATSPEDFVGGVPATLGFDGQGGTVATYDLAGATPESVEWSDLVNPDESITQPVTYQVNTFEWSDPTV